MAEAIANSLGQSRFVVTSAGIERAVVDPGTIAFLRSKGIDISRATMKTVGHVPHLDHYQVIVGLHPSVRASFPPPPTKVVCLEWTVDDPSSARGAHEDVQVRYEAAYDYLHKQIEDLANAILGDKATKGC